MRETADGTVCRDQNLVSSGGPLGHHLVNYHRTMLERASAAIESIPRDEREIASLTLCVSEQRLREIKQQLRSFRRELLQTAEQDDTPERVVQINFQLFPSPRVTHDLPSSPNLHAFPPQLYTFRPERLLVGSRGNVLGN